MSHLKTIMAVAAALSLVACKSEPQPVFPEGGEQFTTPNKGLVELGCIFHGSVALAFEGTIIHIDPVTQMREQTIDYTGYGQADAIFITHDHGDHLCEPAIEQLSKEGTKLFVNGSSYEKIQKGTVLKEGDEGKLTDKISYKAVAAYNTTEGHTMFHPKGVGNGYLFDIDGLVIYVAGDTEVIDEMSQLGHVDVALLPVNQPFTMTPEQCIEAAKIINPAILVPYHLGETDIQKIADGLEDTGIDVRLHESLR
ncbi:MAG: MBL fold metallo-hydrolase [Bacteroidales bacterium]|nr:MBL fold metallo-hydrolase [Bacteroidales bacterium]